MSRRVNRVRQENVFRLVIRRFVGQEARRRKVGVHVPVIAGLSHVDRNLRVEAIRQVAVYRIGGRIGQFVRISLLVKRELAAAWLADMEPVPGCGCPFREPV